MFGLQEKGLRKYMERNGIKAKQYDEIISQELDMKVRKLVERFPTAGYFYSFIFIKHEMNFSYWSIRHCVCRTGIWYCNKY